MILALETSCDETALALFDPASGVRGEWIHSQIVLHAGHGGVVPDLAAREHLRHLGPLLAHATAAASSHARNGGPGVSRLAVTRGPGLAGCLALGVAGAQALGLAWRVPVQGVNHLRGHLYSPFIPAHAADPAQFAARLADGLPHLGLIVSGGNTLLCALGPDLRLTVLSSTRDDAAGEAFDKGAKLLGLGYPGGPLIERHARTGDPAAYAFPRGIGARADLDFSFSGLKTSLRYQLEKMTPAEITTRLPDLCASYQQAILDALVRKTGFALQRGAFRSLGLSGGVANNRPLRAAFARLAAERGLPLLAAEPRHTGDNAAMIAFAAWLDSPTAAPPPSLLRIEPGLELA